VDNAIGNKKTLVSNTRVNSYARFGKRTIFGATSGKDEIVARYMQEIRDTPASATHRAADAAPVYADPESLRLFLGGPKRLDIGRLFQLLRWTRSVKFRHPDLEGK
jgi:hypothetical protein